MFLVTYLLAIAAAILLRVVAIAAAIARATVVQLRLVAQAIASIATSELGHELVATLVSYTSLAPQVVKKLDLDQMRA